MPPPSFQAGRATVAGGAGKAARATGRKQQQMPLCDYGAACTRRGCVYRHPPKPKTTPAPERDADAPVCMAFLAGFCTYGRRCQGQHPPPEVVEQLLQRYARIPCQWSEGCRTAGCLYLHPWDQWHEDIGDALDEAVRGVPGQEAPKAEASLVRTAVSMEQAMPERHQL